MPKLTAAFLLNSIYKKLHHTHTQTHAPLELPGKAILVGSSAGLWRTGKNSDSQIVTEEKVFQVEGILSKNTSKWIVLEHHVWDMRLERSKEELWVKRKQKRKTTLFSTCLP